MEGSSSNELVIDFMIEFVKNDRLWHGEIIAFYKSQGCSDMSKKARFKIMEMYELSL